MAALQKTLRQRFYCQFYALLNHLAAGLLNNLTTDHSLSIVALDQIPATQAPMTMEGAVKIGQATLDLVQKRFKLSSSELAVTEKAAFIVNGDRELPSLPKRLEGMGVQIQIAPQLTFLKNKGVIEHGEGRGNWRFTVAVYEILKAGKIREDENSGSSASVDAARESSLMGLLSKVACENGQVVLDAKMFAHIHEHLDIGTQAALVVVDSLERRHLVKKTARQAKDTGIRVQLKGYPTEPSPSIGLVHKRSSLPVGGGSSHIGYRNCGGRG